MDPITVTIVTALSSGAIAATKDVATSAVKDAYAALKKLIVDRYKKAGPFVEAVEADPASQPEQAVLANQLKGEPADLEEAKKLALALLASLRQLENNPHAQAVLEFGKLRAAQSFELHDIEFSGTLLHADEAVIDGPFRASGLRQKTPGTPQGN
jgi:hypothetical protein